jgi:hypothetical protein
MIQVSMGVSKSVTILNKQQPNKEYKLDIFGLFRFNSLSPVNELWTSKTQVVNVMAMNIFGILSPLWMS